MRGPFSITFSVWRAIFLREALDRLFGERAAWFWLLIEPIMHICFFVWVRTVMGFRNVGGMDAAVWLMVGLLSFFLFRRTGLQVMHAVDSNRPLFAYRQVKPFDTAFVRGALEAFLMILISASILLAARLLGYATIPADLLLVVWAASGLWLLGMGYGLVASVLMMLVPELKHILNILMLPLYLISGAMIPIVTVPQPWRDLLMLNPIAHGLEAVRLGFAPHYHAVPETSLFYPHAFAVVCIFLGLLLYRRFDLRLVMQ
jgi:capsular polysaccharide transport system permease protein